MPDLAAIKARVREMEEEAEKLKQMQTEVDKQMSMGSPPGLSEFYLLVLTQIIPNIQFDIWHMTFGLKMTC